MQNKKVDVIVIGGGVIGVSIAYYTALQGASVLLVEKAGIASGCSFGNAGLIAPSHCNPLPAPGVVAQGLRYLMNPEGPLYIHLRPDVTLARWLWKFYRSCNQKHFYHCVGILRKLGIETLELHKELVAEAGDAQYDFAQNGVMKIYLDEKTFMESQEDVARMRSYGIESTILSGDEVREMEPAAGPHVVGGLINKMDGRLHPADFVMWLAGKAEDAGVKFLTDTEVFGWKINRRRVSGVLTTRGDLEADQVVLAAGAWISELSQQLGVRVPIQAAKGYSLSYARPEEGPRFPLLLEEARVAVTPFAQTLRLAGTLELSGLELGIQHRRLQAIETQTCRYLPGLSGLKTRKIWRGLRPCTPDGLPVLGRLHPYLNVLVAGGHGTKGMVLGPVTGKYIAQMLAGQSIGMLERSLRPNRF